jgi:hypothetical protein
MVGFALLYPPYWAGAGPRFWKHWMAGFALLYPPYGKIVGWLCADRVGSAKRNPPIVKPPARNSPSP